MNELTSQEMLEINGGVDGDTIVAGGTMVGMATSAAIGCKRQTLADSTKIYQASYRLTIYQKHWRFQS